MRDIGKILLNVKKAISGVEELKPHLFPVRRVDFDYIGFVKAKERPRFSKTGRVFTAKATLDFENDAAGWMKNAMDGKNMPPLVGAVRVTLEVFDEIPDNWPEWKRQLAKLKLLYHMKGDVDNKAKSILDAANGVVFFDDRQIVELTIRRRYRVKPGFKMVAEELPSLTAVEFRTLEKSFKGS